MRVHEGLCVLGARCFVCQDLVMFLYCMCCSVNWSVCIVCLTVFGEAIRNMYGCGCYFVVECYGSV